jgi:cell wall assembly regulator SMI1
MGLWHVGRSRSSVAKLVSIADPLGAIPATGEALVAGLTFWSCPDFRGSTATFSGVSLMSPEPLHQALDRLYAGWLTLGVPLAEHLADPLVPSDTVTTLERVGLEAPEELTAWFSWHDGYSYPDNTDRALTQCGIGGFALMPMRYCLRELAAWREVLADEPGPDVENWFTSWFPLLRNGAGNAVVAVVGDGPACQTGLYDPEVGFRAATESITALVNRWADRIERGEWTWTSRFGWMSDPPGLVTEAL